MVLLLLLLLLMNLSSQLAIYLSIIQQQNARARERESHYHQEAQKGASTNQINTTINRQKAHKHVTTRPNCRSVERSATSTAWCARSVGRRIRWRYARLPHHKQALTLPPPPSPTPIPNRCTTNQRSHGAFSRPVSRSLVRSFARSLSSSHDTHLVSSSGSSGRETPPSRRACSAEYTSAQRIRRASRPR